MKMSNKLPEKKIEDDKIKKSSPTAPIIETPIPPQVMDPSLIPPSGPTPGLIKHGYKKPSKRV